MLFVTFVMLNIYIYIYIYMFMKINGLCPVLITTCVNII